MHLFEVNKVRLFLTYFKFVYRAEESGELITNDTLITGRARWLMHAFTK